MNLIMNIPSVTKNYSKVPGETTVTDFFQEMRVTVYFQEKEMTYLLLLPLFFFFFMNPHLGRILSLDDLVVLVKVLSSLPSTLSHVKRVNPRRIEPIAQ